MPMRTADPAVVTDLRDLTRLLQKAEGFHEVVAALKNRRGAIVDGTWGSSASLTAAALGLHATQTLLIVLAHPSDVDGWADDIAGFAGQRPVIFPAWETLPTDRSAVDEIAGQRLRQLRQLESATPPRFLLTTIQALIQPVPNRAELAQNRRRLRRGAEAPPDELADWLVAHGFEPAETVVLPGQFGRRGGIFDLFPPDAENPVRIEFFGDEVESLRYFSPQTQRRLEELQELEITGVASAPASGTAPKRGNSAPVSLSGHLCDYLPSECWTMVVEPEDLDEQGRHYRDRVIDATGLFTVPGVFAQLLRFPSIRLTTLPSAGVEATCHLRIESVERFSGNVAKLREELAGAAAGDRLLIACHNEAELRRLSEILEKGGERGSRIEDRGSRTEDRGSKIEDRGSRTDPFITLTIGKVKAGFRMVEAGVVVLGDHELFRREEARQVLPRRRLESRAIDSFLDLAEGDLVVHISHGIALFRGMQVLEKNGQAEEHLLLEFREGTRVYVPVSKIDLVQKYVGGARSDPELSRLGGTSWQRKKERVSQAVMDLASEMIELQALREAQPGNTFPPDSDWQAEFEAAFPYEETPDQLTTLGEIKQDMQRARPMDRLVCGDVGYGKTELAVRAAFKAVDNGKQVAVLVPTTVLAEQHFRTFRQRFAEYPFVVDSISRFRSHGEQREILERLKQGGIDVIIGTHRIVSADVAFKDLGLVIIDEEQRFGVEHKERLKRLRQTVDVLTLTATPIPRTLHLSLLGIRDISNLETPPADRLAIETRIVRFDAQIIRHAIVRELNREGQVYFVHNRVHNIKEIASKIQSIVPEARISIAHGQMAEGELEQAMLAFVRRESDILIATTIIESGLDIPNVNTIFINQADNYGLADLHQLRGRVGRYKHRAYAYLLLDADKGVTGTAARRLKAIEEFTELGAGFKIAMRDLEIRGAGNILGTQQSGHIAAVGYELYCQLLENAVRERKQMPSKAPLEVALDLPIKAYLPRDYVPGQKLRVEVYRRLARLRKLDRLEDFRAELGDRFGPIPEPAEWLLRLAEIRLLATRWQVVTMHLEEKDVVLGYKSPRLIRRLTDRAGPRLRVVDEHSAYYKIGPHDTEPVRLYSLLKELLRFPV